MIKSKQRRRLHVREITSELRKTVRNNRGGRTYFINKDYVGNIQNELICKLRTSKMFLRLVASTMINFKEDAEGAPSWAGGLA